MMGVLRKKKPLVPVRADTPADSVKVALIDYLLKWAPPFADVDQVIVSEMGFANWSRRADLVELTDIMQGFEIKSAHDHLTHLREQLEDYCEHFDKVWLVVDVKHFMAALDGGLPAGVGLLVYEDGVISQKVEASLQKNEIFDVVRFASLIRGADLTVMLRRKIGTAVNGLLVREKRQRAALVFSRGTLHEAAVASLRGHFEARWKFFMQNKSNPTRPGDMRLLEGWWK